MHKMDSLAPVTGTVAVPLPGTELVPPGWWESTVVPWADRQVEDEAIRRADAELAGFEFGRPPDAVVCLRGGWQELQWLVFDGSPLQGWDDTTLKDVKGYIRSWAGQPDYLNLDSSAAAGTDEATRHGLHIGQPGG